MSSPPPQPWPRPPPNPTPPPTPPPLPNPPFPPVDTAPDGGAYPESAGVKSSMPLFLDGASEFAEPDSPTKANASKSHPDHTRTCSVSEVFEALRDEHKKDIDIEETWLALSGKLPCQMSPYHGPGSPDYSAEFEAEAEAQLNNMPQLQEDDTNMVEDVTWPVSTTLAEMHHALIAADTEFVTAVMPAIETGVNAMTQLHEENNNPSSTVMTPTETEDVNNHPETVPGLERMVAAMAATQLGDDPTDTPAEAESGEAPDGGSDPNPGTGSASAPRSPADHMYVPVPSLRESVEHLERFLIFHKVFKNSLLVNGNLRNNRLLRPLLEQAQALVRRADDTANIAENILWIISLWRQWHEHCIIMEKRRGIIDIHDETIRTNPFAEAFANFNEDVNRGGATSNAPKWMREERFVTRVIACKVASTLEFGVTGGIACALCELNMSLACTMEYVDQQIALRGSAARRPRR